MLARLYNGLAILAIATLLALGGFTGFLLASGRLTAERVGKLAAVLRGELDRPPAAPPATQPQRPDQPAQLPRLRSAEQIRKALIGEQLRRATLERTARDVLARQELLDHALQDLLTRQEKLREEQAAWAARKQQEAQALRDQGFQQELRLVAKLSPKLAKQHVILTWNKHRADAVRLLKALEPGRAQRILDQFKTPQEVEVMHQLLEQLRLGASDELAAGSGKASGDAPP